jgi:hypothetical protein
MLGLLCGVGFRHRIVLGFISLDEKVQFDQVVEGVGAT